MTLSTVRCQILGKAEIHTRGIRVMPETEVQFGLAMYFCANAGRQVPRDDVARLFWPESGIEAARHNLRQSLYRLRVLGVPVRSGAKWSQLETHMVEADYAPVVAEGAPASVFMRLTDVAVLPGYSPKFSRAYARWVEEFRTDVGTRMRRGLVRAITEMRARGRYTDVERLCRFCLGLDPLNEEATLALAEAVALAGGKVEAVGMIERYAGEVSRYPAELRLPASLLRERISDRLIRRAQAQMELPMIGREEDVERIVAAFQRLKGNRSVSYIVTGGSGVGKTRLATECCRIGELQGARTITIGTQPSSRTQALFAVSELVDHMLQLPGAIGCAPSALECLRGLSGPLNRREPRLSMETDAEARFAMVRWSILDVLDAILSEGPLLIHVDDAHQLDTQSQLILQDALRTHATRPLLVLLTMRPWAPEDTERFERLASESTLHELAPLSDDSCDRLVHRFCAAHEESLDAHTRERIIQLSGGNPFFLLELLKHRTDLVTDDLPVSVQALLEDRLAKLSPTALTVLRAAAVLGLSSNVERLHLVVERKTSEVLTALTELHNAGMLSTHDSGTVCRHDSIRDAVLERTPTAARRLLHRRAAKVLGAEVRRDGGVAELWECLHHWRAAGTPSKGIPLALRLARRLLRLGIIEDSLRVLEDVERMSPDLRISIRALSGQAQAARLQRDWSRISAIVKRWLALQHDHGIIPAPHSRFELLAEEAAFYSSDTFGSTSPSLLSCAACRTASDAHRLSAGMLAAVAAHNCGDAEHTKDVFDAVRELVGSTKEERILRLTIEGVYEGSYGSVERARSALEEAVRVAKTMTQQVRRFVHIRRACFGLIRYGDRAEARELLGEARSVFTRLGLASQALVCVEQIGQDAIWQGRIDEALICIRQAHELSPLCREHVATPIEQSLRTLLAFETLDASLLDESLGAFPVPPGHLRRVRQQSVSLISAQQLIRGKTPSDSARAEMLTLHEHLRLQGDQDFPVAVLCTTLAQCGRELDARSTLERYASVRREPYEPPICLLRIQAALLRSQPPIAARL